MRDYGRLSPLFWIRGTGKKLRDHQEARMLAVYLMSSPGSNMIGLYYLSAQTVAEHMGWSEQQVLDAFDVLQRHDIGFAIFDQEEELVFIPEAARWQIAETLRATDKKVKGIDRNLKKYAHHPFHDLFVERYGGPYHLSTASLGRGFEGPSGSREATSTRRQVGASGSALQGHVEPQEAPSKEHPTSQEQAKSKPCHASDGRSGDASVVTAAPSPNKGKHLCPADFTPTEAERERARDDHRTRLTDRQIDDLTEGFINYWRAEPAGKTYKKTSEGWHRTWWERCKQWRSYNENAPRYQPPPPRPEPTPLELAAAGPRIIPEHIRNMTDDEKRRYAAEQQAIAANKARGA